MGRKQKIQDLLIYDFKKYQEDSGFLVPIESNQDVPFPIRRVFYVYNTPPKTKRGMHSHYKTKQVLIALKGKITVTCDDGEEKKEVILDHPNKALYIPEGIWADEIYHTKDTILMVLCNTKYDLDDYITDYDEFLEWRKN